MSSERPDGTLSENFADILKAMAHPVRLMILKELLKNPRCVTAIHEILYVRQPNISQHLTILKNSGLVLADRDGAYRCYYLRWPGFVKAVLDALGSNWPEADIDEVKSSFRIALNKRLEEKKETTERSP
jgi:DNA-binding transcriptional ArsR family regulator